MRDFSRTAQGIYLSRRTWARHYAAAHFAGVCATLYNQSTSVVYVQGRRVIAEPEDVPDDARYAVVLAGPPQRVTGSMEQMLVPLIRNHGAAVIGDYALIAVSQACHAIAGQYHRTWRTAWRTDSVATTLAPACDWLYEHGAPEHGWRAY